jgi:hypothetical protein
MTARSKLIRACPLSLSSCSSPWAISRLQHLVGVETTAECSEWLHFEGYDGPGGWSVSKEVAGPTVDGVAGKLVMTQHCSWLTKNGLGNQTFWPQYIKSVYWAISTVRTRCSMCACECMCGPSWVCIHRSEFVGACARACVYLCSVDVKFMQCNVRPECIGVCCRCVL